MGIAYLNTKFKRNKAKIYLEYNKFKKREFESLVENVDTQIKLIEVKQLWDIT